MGGGTATTTKLTTELYVMISYFGACQNDIWCRVCLFLAHKWLAVTWGPRRSAGGKSFGSGTLRGRCCLTSSHHATGLATARKIRRETQLQCCQIHLSWSSHSSKLITSQVAQGLVNVPFWGWILNITFKYLLEITSH